MSCKKKYDDDVKAMECGIWESTANSSAHWSKINKGVNVAIMSLYILTSLLNYCQSRTTKYRKCNT